MIIAALAYYVFRRQPLRRPPRFPAIILRSLACRFICADAHILTAAASPRREMPERDASAPPGRRYGDNEPRRCFR